MYWVLAILCYVFAAADYFLAEFGIVDITGVWWSPIVAGILGAFFSHLAQEKEK